MSEQTIQELREAFGQVDPMDDRALLDWLKKMFEACAAEKAEVPGRDAIASRIGVARKMLPNPELSIMPPRDEPGHTQWALTLSINTLITYPPNGQLDRLAELYGITGFAIGTWQQMHGGASQ